MTDPARGQFKPGIHRTSVAPHGSIDTYPELVRLADQGSTVAEKSADRLVKLAQDEDLTGTDAGEVAAPMVHGAIVHAAHELIHHHHPVLASILRGFMSSLAEHLTEISDGN